MTAYDVRCFGEVLDARFSGRGRDDSRSVKRPSRYFGIAEFAERPIAENEGAVVDDDFELTAAAGGIFDVSGNVAGMVAFAHMGRSLTVLDAVIPRQTGVLAQGRVGECVRQSLGCIELQLAVAAVQF